MGNADMCDVSSGTLRGSDPVRLIGDEMSVDEGFRKAYFWHWGFLTTGGGSDRRRNHSLGSPTLLNEGGECLSGYISL